MAVRRQITLCFIICCCAEIIYTDDLADRKDAPTTVPSEEFSNRTELETGNLSGKITAHKNGAKLELKINSKVIWKKDKSIESKICSGTSEQEVKSGDTDGVGLLGLKGEKGEQGDKGDNGLAGIKGERGEKGNNGIDGQNGEKGEKGDKGDNGLAGIKGEMGEKGNNGIDGQLGEKGEKGDKGDNGLAGIKGERGEKGNNGIDGQIGEKGEKGDKGDNGLAGIKGERGENGNNGFDGQKGEKGDPGICRDSYEERRPDNYGKINHPAYSCFDVSENKMMYVNRANGFEVLCQDYQSCIPKLPRINAFSGLIKNAVWLSSYKFDLKKFYNLRISELSYLMTTNEGFHLILKYSNEVEILEILSWNGLTMKTKSEPLSNGCKGTIKNEGTQTRLEVKCKPANYLPMDFLIKTSTENVSIQLLSLCFS